MNKKYCKAVTRKGQQCKNRPLDSGYCSIHDPEIRKENIKKKSRIDKLLKIVTQTCQQSGWAWEVDSYDKTDFATAIVSVSKYIKYQSISALVHIFINPNETMNFRVEKTSFDDYGVEALSSAINNALERGGWHTVKEKPEPKELVSLDILLQIFKRFHRSAVQLSKRYDNRDTLIINDEYDVQNYMYAILKIFFDDIRPEEYTPSYAGSCSRMDFLLKAEKIVIETKYASPKLKDKKIGEQLIVDIQHYQQHPDCRGS